MQTHLTTDCFFHKVHNPVMAKLDKDEAFGTRFKSLVIEKGWKDLNRLDIGKKIGTSGTCATYYMNGDRLPSVAQAKTLCKIFGGVCVEWFLTGRGPKYPGEEISLQNHINVADLTDDQRALINQMMAQFTPKTLENNLNKPLTTPVEKMWGGVNLPVQNQQSQDRLTKTRPNQFEIDLAIEHERCVMVRHQEQMEANARYIELVKDKCQNNECYCEPPCPDVETPLLGYMQIIEAVKK